MKNILFVFVTFIFSSQLVFGGESECLLTRAMSHVTPYLANNDFENLDRSGKGFHASLLPIAAEKNNEKLFKRLLEPIPKLKFC